MRRIGIMGGTFDPIHNGHVLIAGYAQEQFALDQVLFIPTGTPPHKLHLMTPGTQRLDMVRLATAELTWACASDLEIKRDGMTYSVDTLHALHAAMPDAVFYFIVGEDTLPLLVTWRNAAEVATLTHFLVVARKGVTLDLEKTAESVRAQIGAKISFIDGEGPEISSSEIRQRCRDGRSVSDLLPEKVLAYIRENGLYR